MSAGRGAANGMGVCPCRPLVVPAVVVCMRRGGRARVSRVPVCVWSVNAPLRRPAPGLPLPLTRLGV